MQPTDYNYVNNIDPGVKKHLLQVYVFNQTHDSIYKDPENLIAMNLFFEEHKVVYNTMYRRADMSFHMTLYVLLSIHFGIDKDDVERAILDGDMLEFAYNAIKDTDYIKEMMNF